VNDFATIEAVIGPAVILWICLRRRNPVPGFAGQVELAGISLALGIGFTSSTFFLWRLTGLPLGWYAAADLAFQALVLALVMYRPRRVMQAPGADSRGHARSTLAVTGAITAAAVCVGAVAFGYFTIRLPRGEWDAWSIWNLRAAFLSVPDGHWRDGFVSTLAWSHPDYPLLVPASVARLWTFDESGAVFGPRLVAAAFVLSVALVMAGSVARRAGPVGMSLALALLMVPTFLYWGASQTADVPLGAFVLIAIAALSKPPGSRRYLLAGLAAGFAAWTKNEGLVAAAAIILAGLAAARRDKNVRPDLLALVAGLAIAGLPLLLFKLTLAPETDLVRQIISQQPMEKATETARHAFVAGYLAREFFLWGGLTPIPASTLLLACIALAAVQWGGVPRDATTATYVLAVMLVAYYWVYVLSPYDLEWHLRTSATRLIAQVWPAMVWTVTTAMAGAAAAPPPFKA